MDFKDAKAIVFDLDYTLIDSSEGIVYCFNEARKRVGEPAVEAESIKKRIGIPIDQTFALFGSKEPEAMRDMFRKIARDGAIAARSFLLTGVAETLALLKEKGYRMAVASTKSHAEIDRIMKHLGLDGNFEQYVGSDEVESAKPAPDPLILMAERLGLETREMVYVGDHVVDVLSAKSAGCRAIIVEAPTGPCSRAEIEAENPDAIIPDIKAILKLF